MNSTVSIKETMRPVICTFGELTYGEVFIYQNSEHIYSILVRIPEYSSKSENKVINAIHLGGYPEGDNFIQKGYNFSPEVTVTKVKDITVTKLYE